MRIQLLGFISAVFLLASCNNGGHCYESVDTLMVTTFIGNNSSKIGPMVVRGYGRSALGDTLLNNLDSALTKRIGLPLSLTADSTGYVVTANGRTSIFWVRHTMNIQLISQDCGFAPYYQVNATRHTPLIDSMIVYNPVIDPKSIETYSTSGQNITIYLHLTAN
jgi:hypothetical protein